MKLRTRALCTMLALLLGACAGTTTRGPVSGTSGMDPALSERSHAETAVMYLDEASNSEGQVRVAVLENAAWAAARAERTELLEQAIKLYPDMILSPEQLATYHAYRALAHAFKEEPQQALQLLASSPSPERDQPLSDYFLAQALAYQQLDDGEAATLMLVNREAHLPENLREQNHQRIWALQLEASRFLFSDSQSRYDASTQGWLELGRIARRFWTDGLALQQSLQQWPQRFPGHPAYNLYWPMAGEIATKTLNSAARHIALLLPTSGRLANAAAAVRDGFLAAHFAGNAKHLDIRIYDSSQNAVASYEQALADGADLIVGPLDKAQVESVIARNAERLPMLALNYRDAAPPANAVLEYGLSPEDNARSVALRAIADGHSHAIALISQDDWGQRSLSAFRQTFTEAGGILLDYRSFQGGPREYPNTIKDLLRLDESRARSAEMERLLGQELDSMPVRRQDAQLLFLAASPGQGRQIRPQIRFYHASDLPIYASGRIYAGHPNPDLDKDLNGVTFCTLPWLLDSSESWTQRRDEVRRAWPRQAKRFERLYAMGNDAYLLASALRNANWQQLPVIPGATGELSRSEQKIQRTLPCARFEQGRPQFQLNS